MPTRRRSGAILVLLTPEEREEVRAAARQDERPMTAWVRRVALHAARSRPVNGWDALEQSERRALDSAGKDPEAPA
jgi:ERCC4-related helicase